MEVFDAVRTVLAVREYQDKSIPPDVVRTIVEAGRLTGSAMNAQPWHFVVVDDRETLTRLGRAATSGPYVAQAPLAVVIAVDKTRFAVSDGSRAIQSMILAAWEHGVGSNWVGFTGGLTAVNEILKIPSALDVLAIIPFGYPTRKLGKGRKERKALEDVASRGRYGQRFAGGPPAATVTPTRPTSARRRSLTSRRPPPGDSRP
jgi:nitroreductase